MSSLAIKRRDGETWRQAAERYAAPWGLQDEVLADFDADIAKGVDEAEAAWGACMERDVLPFEPVIAALQTKDTTDG